jgi:hypothetical protein
MSHSTLDKLLGFAVFLVGVAMETMLPHPTQAVETLGIVAMVTGLMSALHAQLLGPLLEQVVQRAFFSGSSGPSAPPSSRPS